MKKVIVYSRRGTAIIDVAPVVRETKTLVFAGHDGEEQYELKKRCTFEVVDGRRVKVHHYNYPSGEQIKQAEMVLDRRAMLARREQKKREKEEAAERADPRYELLKRFVHAEWEPWDKLTLKQLQQIAKILDSVKEG